MWCCKPDKYREISGCYTNTLSILCTSIQPRHSLHQSRIIFVTLPSWDPSLIVLNPHAFDPLMRNKCVQFYIDVSNAILLVLTVLDVRVILLHFLAMQKSVKAFLVQYWEGFYCPGNFGLIISLISCPGRCNYLFEQVERVIFHPQWTSQPKGGYNMALLKIAQPNNAQISVLGASEFHIYPGSRVSGLILENGSLNVAFFDIIKDHLCPMLSRTDNSTHCVLLRGMKTSPSKLMQRTCNLQLMPLLNTIKVDEVYVVYHAFILQKLK